MDDYGDNSHVPPSCKISTSPLDGASEMFDYRVPVQGACEKKLSFLIECELNSEQGICSFCVQH